MNEVEPEYIVDGLFGKDSRGADLPILPEILPEGAPVADSGQSGSASTYSRSALRGVELVPGTPSDLTTEEMLDYCKKQGKREGTWVARQDETGVTHWRQERVINEPELR